MNANTLTFAVYIILGITSIILVTFHYKKPRTIESFSASKNTDNELNNNMNAILNVDEELVGVDAENVEMNATIAESIINQNNPAMNMYTYFNLGGLPNFVQQASTLGGSMKNRLTSQNMTLGTEINNLIIGLGLGGDGITAANIASNKDHILGLITNYINNIKLVGLNLFVNNLQASGGMEVQQEYLSFYLNNYQKTISILMDLGNYIKNLTPSSAAWTPGQQSNIFSNPQISSGISFFS